MFRAENPTEMLATQAIMRMRASDLKLSNCLRIWLSEELKAKRSNFTEETIASLKMFSQRTTQDRSINCIKYF